jgi:hypothetical protein
VVTTGPHTEKGSEADGLEDERTSDMPLHAKWVPGYVAQAQRVGPGALINVNSIPWTDIVGFREGFGVTLRGRGGTFNWFHLAIPTPVITQDVRVRLQRVFVLYVIDTWALIRNIHVWDGPRRIVAHDGLAHTGNHGTWLDTQNTFNANNNLIYLGVGISVGIQFGSDANVKFTSAGADFRT